MREQDWELELARVAHRLHELAHSAPVNPSHKACLRHELLLRHRELAGRAQKRAVRRFWPRFSGLARLAILGPLALAGSIALSVFFWGLQISGRQSLQTAEAARITQALARTAPTVTSWQWTLKMSGPREAAVVRKQGILSPGQRLFVQSGRLLLYADGQWNQVTVDTVHNPTLTDWNLAFAVLAVDLTKQKFTELAGAHIRGHSTERIRYTNAEGSGREVLITLWIEPSSGLVLRVDRVQINGTRIVEHDRVDYRYTRNR